MDWASKELVGLIYHLLPGFATAWVFYALTAHPRLDAFERIVQALIFTLIVQALTAIGVKPAWLSLGFGWNDDIGLFASTVTALLFGLVLAALANADALHAILRWMCVTKRTSFPSEWYGAFRDERWVVLHLSGSRRLFGWPTLWPDSPDKGHFVIIQPEWILETGERAPLYNVAKVVIPVTDIEMVELLKDTDEVWADAAKVDATRRLLIQLQAKESHDGSESTSAST